MTMWWCTYGPDWQNARTIDEFGGKLDSGTTCGPAANANLWANMQHVAPSYDLVDQITARDIKMGLFNHGQTIWDVYQSYLKGWNWPASKLSLFNYNANGYGAADLRAACQRVGSTRNGGIVVEVSQAYNLPYNEPGVQYHFVAVLGYDAGTDMVLVGNADREPLPTGTGKPDWYALSDLIAGRPVGYCIVLGSTNMGGTVPVGWKDDGTTLTAPNGVVVVQGFRDYVMSHTWDPGNQPLAAEQTVGLLEYSNMALGGGSLQYFRDLALEWRTSDNTVYLMYTGRELMVCRQMIALATAALKATPQ